MISINAVCQECRSDLEIEPRIISDGIVVLVALCPNCAPNPVLRELPNPVLRELPNPVLRELPKPPDRDPLTFEELSALETGTPILVKWYTSHPVFRYTLGRTDDGQMYAHLPVDDTGFNEGPVERSLAEDNYGKPNARAWRDEE